MMATPEMKENKNFIQKANSKIKKKGTEGKFGSWCKRNGLASEDGEVTKECIDKAMKSDNPDVVKMANFAKNIKGFKMLQKKQVKKYIKKQLIIQGDKVTEDENAYLIDVKKEQSLAKEGKTRKLPLFVGEKEGKTFYVAPIYGKGLWDAIWGYVSLDENMVIQGAYFDHKGETPGLGANIKQRYFMDDFIGEHLLSEDGEFKGVKVAKGNNDPKNEEKTDYEVDAIAGATITGDGVTAMIKSDLKLYVPYFQSLKN